MQVEVSLFRKFPFSNALLLPLPIILSCIFYPFCITNGFLLFTLAALFLPIIFYPPQVLQNLSNALHLAPLAPQTQRNRQPGPDIRVVLALDERVVVT